jgi:hypothetical protein
MCPPARCSARRCTTPAGANEVRASPAALSGSTGFGSALAPGDFNGAGFADLAIGSFDEGIAGYADAGIVHVPYGGPSGLSATGARGAIGQALAPHR